MVNDKILPMLLVVVWFGLVDDKDKDLANVVAGLVWSMIRAVH